MRYQTSDYLDFDTATALVRKLYREEKYALSLLIGCGIFFELRISDLLSLRWEQLLNEDDIRHLREEDQQAQYNQYQLPVQTAHPVLL